MRVIVFFDLPVKKPEEKREYRRFRKFLINEGFIMMQNSVYCKLVLNNSVCNAVKTKVNKNSPRKGLVQMLVITEKQYAGIDYITGDIQTHQQESVKRLIVL